MFTMVFRYVQYLMSTYSARRAVIVSKPQASAWGKLLKHSSLGEAICVFCFYINYFI